MLDDTAVIHVDHVKADSLVGVEKHGPSQLLHQLVET